MDIRRLQDEIEAVSALYAERFGIDRVDDWLMLKLGEEVGERAHPGVSLAIGAVA